MSFNDGIIKQEYKSMDNFNKGKKNTRTSENKCQFTSVFKLTLDIILGYFWCVNTFSILFMYILLIFAISLSAILSTLIVA